MKKACWLILSFLLLTGCGLSFYYNKLNWFANWYLDDYVELNSLQQQIFEDHFDNWHQWHRQTQLVQYHQQLSQFKADVENGISPQQIIEHSDQARQHWLNLITHIAPDLANQLLSLSAGQKHQLIKNLHQYIDEQDKAFSEKTASQRIEAVEKRNIKAFKNWFGRVSDKQQSQIKHQLTQYHSSRDLWRSYQKRWLDKFEDLLMSEDEPARQARLTNFLNHPDDLKSTELKRVIEINRQLYARFLASFIAQTSTNQKQHLYDEIDDYLDELDELIH